MRFNKLIPEITVFNLSDSLSFYVELLGFNIEYARPESKFAFLSREGSQIMIQQTQGKEKWKVGVLKKPLGRGVNFQLEVKQISSIIKRLHSHNYPVFAAPKDNWYRQGKRFLGSREFLVQDPDGYLLRFSEDLGSKKF